MARASSKTVSYEARAEATGETWTLIERSYIRSTRVAGGYLRAQKQFALFDTSGRRFERIGQNLVVCIQTNEKFQIIGMAESIRKVQSG